MIIFLNGWPGVGKLTVARHLVAATGGRLLDAHTIYNVAFYLTEFRTPVFYETVRKVRDIAFDRVVELPPRTPVVMTNAFAAVRIGPRRTGRQSERLPTDAGQSCFL